MRIGTSVVPLPSVLTIVPEIVQGPCKSPSPTVIDRSPKWEISILVSTVTEERNVLSSSASTTASSKSRVTEMSCVPEEGAIIEWLTHSDSPAGIAGTFTISL